MLIFEVIIFSLHDFLSVKHNMKERIKHVPLVHQINIHSIFDRQERQFLPTHFSLTCLYSSVCPFACFFSKTEHI